MVRRYRRRTFNKDKYSVEQTNSITPGISEWSVIPASDASQASSSQYSILVVPSSDTQGPRKVKHLTISIANNGSTTENIPMFYSIVYVPQGYENQPIRLPAEGYSINNYQANQFVMSSGVIDFSGGPTRLRSPLSRNLNSGDSIFLILACRQSDLNANFYVQVQYAITLQ